MIARGLLLAGVLLGCVPGAHAITDEDMCRNGLFPSLYQTARMGAATGGAGPRLYFYDDNNGCPMKGESCRTPRYVVPGDELIVGVTRGDWACVWYPGRKHETVGWVPSRGVSVQPPDERPDWVGEWHDAPSGISIKRDGAGLHAQGGSKWTGAELPDGSRVEHFGDFNDALAVTGRYAHVGPARETADPSYFCAVDLARVGRFLIAHDNANCGAMNVRFDGVYTRDPVKAPQRRVVSRGSGG